MKDAIKKYENEPNVQFYKTEIQLMLLEVNTKRKLNIITAP